MVPLSVSMNAWVDTGGLPTRASAKTSGGGEGAGRIRVAASVAGSSCCSSVAAGAAPPSPCRPAPWSGPASPPRRRRRRARSARRRGRCRSRRRHRAGTRRSTPGRRWPASARRRRRRRRRGRPDRRPTGARSTRPPPLGALSFVSAARTAGITRWSVSSSIAVSRGSPASGVKPCRAPTPAPRGRSSADRDPARTAR